VATRKNLLARRALTPLIATKDQDSVRLLAVEGCAALGKLLEPQDYVAHILPVIVNFYQYLTENNYFVMIGVIGLPGVGKSTIMNELC